MFYGQVTTVWLFFLRIEKATANDRCTEKCLAWISMGDVLALLTRTIFILDLAITVFRQDLEEQVEAWQKLQDHHMSFSLATALKSINLFFFFQHQILFPSPLSTLRLFLAHNQEYKNPSWTWQVVACIQTGKSSLLYIAGELKTWIPQDDTAV